MKKLDIDHERGQVVANLLTDTPTVILISQGKAQCFEMAAHGEFLAKTHEGKITHWKNSEGGRM